MLIIRLSDAQAKNRQTFRGEAPGFYRLDQRIGAGLLPDRLCQPVYYQQALLRQQPPGTLED